MITARIVADSVSQNGIRIASVELIYPRFIHAELMTHRVFSRNSASSRAIPIEKMIGAVRGHPAEPKHWGQNKKGMQADSELTGWKLRAAKAIWAYHRWMTIWHVKLLNWVGLHKQCANRLLEPHSHIKVLVTSTLWENFFQLRAHPDAQPEMQELANAIIEAGANSIPETLEAGEWHLPYITEGDRISAFVNEIGIAPIHKLRLISAARCARVSYTTFDNAKDSPARDYRLGYRLINSSPLHASPFEHQAMADPHRTQTALWGNFHGWVQHRKMMDHEARMEESYYSRGNKVIPLTR